MAQAVKAAASKPHPRLILTPEAEKQLRKVHDKVQDRRVKATPLSRAEVEIEAQAAPEGEAE